MVSSPDRLRRRAGRFEIKLGLIHRDPLSIERNQRTEIHRKRENGDAENNPPFVNPSSLVVHRSASVQK